MSQTDAERRYLCTKECSPYKMMECHDTYVVCHPTLKLIYKPIHPILEEVEAERE